MKRIPRAILFPLLFIALSAEGGSSAPHGNWQAPPDDPLSQGGRLYDKWWTELHLPEPTQTHPAYPEGGSRRGSDSWRCKECHGWDYRGRDGAYGSGGHATGIKGIRGYEGGEPSAVLQILVDERHQYHTVMGAPALDRLALFVVQGQVAMERYLDVQGNLSSGGDTKRGRALFENHCARCHDDDGRYQNFTGDAAAPEYIGTVAQKNPWEMWHKIRNGHPGSRMPMGPAMMGRWRHDEAMPPFRSLTLEEQLAILAYARTLPVR